jgi:hypothetical protein
MLPGVLTAISMVERMDHSEDVERLFSWLKAPMVHYREFAPETEFSEAVATWPVVHKAAVETGVAGDQPEPQGDAVARERIARRRVTLPAAPEPPAMRATAGRLADRPAEAPPAAQQAEAVSPPVGDMPAPQPRLTVEPSTPAGERTGAESSATSAEAIGEDRSPPDRASAQRYYPARDRGALFGGEYRERGRGAPDERPADRHDRSLDAVFSRLSGGRDRLPDPRVRSRTAAGLGSVFNRLR